MDAVRAALADLPEATRDELLEDLPEHLAEVLADGDGSLVERLGTPGGVRRRAAGQRRLRRRLPRPAAARAPPRRAARTTLQRLRVDDAGRPALRVRAGQRVPGAAAPGLVGAARLPGGDGARLDARRQRPAARPAAPHRRQRGRRPAAAGRARAGLDLVRPPLAAPSSGPGARSTPARWCSCWWRSAASNADSSARGADYSDVNYDNPYSNVEDLFVYDEQGRLVDHARIFDQDGQPIRLGNEYCYATRRTSTRLAHRTTWVIRVVRRTPRSGCRPTLLTPWLTPRRHCSAAPSPRRGWSADGGKGLGGALAEQLRGSRTGAVRLGSRPQPCRKDHP